MGCRVGRAVIRSHFLGDRNARSIGDALPGPDCAFVAALTLAFPSTVPRDVQLSDSSSVYHHNAQLTGMLFIFGSASTAARVPTTAQASALSMEEAALSHMVELYG
jgi:hypothetical protein